MSLILTLFTCHTNWTWHIILHEIYYNKLLKEIIWSFICIESSVGVSVPKQMGWTLRWKVLEATDLIIWWSDCWVAGIDNLLCILCYTKMRQNLINCFWNNRLRDVYHTFFTSGHLAYIYLYKGIVKCIVMLTVGCHGNSSVCRWKSCCPTLSFQNTLIIHTAAAAACHMLDCVHVLYVRVFCMFVCVSMSV